MADYKITDLQEELIPPSGSYFESSVPSPSGFVSKKVKLENFAAEPVAGTITWTNLSSNTNAQNNYGYLSDASSNTVDVTLPSSPSVGDRVGVKALDITNALTVNRNGSKIEGSETDLEVDVDGAGFTLVYSGSTYGWVVVTEISGGGSTGSINSETIWALYA